MSLGQVGHAAGGESWLPFGRLSVKSSYLRDHCVVFHCAAPCFYFQVGKSLAGVLDGNSLDKEKCLQNEGPSALSWVPGAARV